MLAKFDGECLPDLRPVPAGARSSGNVGYWQISLQKSGTTGHRGWRERLEQAAYLSSP